MKRMRIMGLCLVAAFALSAFAVSSASALPEVGRCVAKESGKYKDANCKEKPGKLESEEAFEFVKGSGGLNGFTGAGGAAFLEGESGVKITCKTNSANGKLDEDSGAIKEVENVVGGYTGCELPLIEGSCQNTATAGELKTNSLHGPFGYIKKVGAQLGSELTPDVKHGAFIEFECGKGAVKVVVKEGEKGGHNCIISEVTPANTMATTSTTIYHGKGGHQEPNKFEGKTECNLESKATGPIERSDQNQETVLTYETALELKG